MLHVNPIIRCESLKTSRCALKAGLKLLILSVAGITSLLGNTYYVATNGSDSASGTLAAPFRTIRHGVGVLSAGDTLYVRAGTYQESAILSRSGTSGSPILISGYPGETAIIDGNNMTIPAQNGGGGLLQGSGISYVTIQNLTVAHSGYQGIALGGTYITVDHITAYGNWAAPVMLYGSYVTISNNTVYDNNQMNVNGNNQYNYDNSLTCGTYSGTVTDHCAITNNTCYNDWGDGPSLVNSTLSTMTGNVSFNNWAEQYYIQNSTYSVIDGNLAYVTSGNPRAGYGGGQHGMQVGDEKTANSTRDLTITNNFLLGGRTVINFYPNDYLNIVVANNTFVNVSTWNAVSTLHFNSPTGTNSGGSLFQNNIIEEDSSYPTDSGSSSGVTFSRNLWSKSPSMGTRSGDIVANPQLAKSGSTAAGSLSPDWFKLVAGSPAIGKASVLSQVKYDFFHNPRGQYPDAGGDQYLAAVTSSDTTAPLVPTGLTVTGASSSSISLQWNASSDNVAVTGYRVYRNGAQIATAPGTSFQDTGLAASTTYYYTVAAYDGAGNVSPASSQAAGSTTAAADTTAPSTPTNLSGSAVSSSAINVSWSASADNVGVQGYRVYRGGAQIANVTSGTSYGDAGLSASTTYTYTVAAYDAAGNISAQSSPLNVSTPAAAPTTTPTAPTGPALAVAITNPLNGSTVNRLSTVQLQAVATDGATVNGIVWNVDGVTMVGALTPTSSTTTVSTVNWNTGGGRGWHTITVTATDSTGATATATERVRTR